MAPKKCAKPMPKKRVVPEAYARACAEIGKRKKECMSALKAVRNKMKQDSVSHLCIGPVCLVIRETMGCGCHPTVFGTARNRGNWHGCAGKLKSCHRRS